MGNYVERTKQEFDQFMGKLGFVEVFDRPANEVVYARQMQMGRDDKKVYFPYDVEVYSSVERLTKVTRNSGKDAIRIQVRDRKTGRLAPFSGRVFRTENALQNLEERIREVWMKVANAKKCPTCGAIMVIRTGNAKFWGCTRYSPGREYHCSTTVAIELS